MTTDQMSAIPAEVAAVRAAEAGRLLDATQNADVNPSASNATSINYAGVLKALTTTAVANGQALLAVHADLARIANALEKQAETPAALDRLTAALAPLRGIAAAMQSDDNPLARLAAVADGGLDGVSAELHTLHAAVDDLAAPRPRWWQWRLRRAIRDAQAAADEPAVAEEGPAEEYELRLHLAAQVEPWNPAEHGVLASCRFTSTDEEARGVALRMIPDLCAAVGVATNPDLVYGRIFRIDQDGEFWHVDSVFLPGATVISAPPDGF